MIMQRRGAKRRKVRNYLGPFFFALLASLLVGNSCIAETKVHTAGCTRIVSLAPSLTELAFALSLGDRVVGVTRYCRFPPEAATRPKIGGFLDPSYESILLLHPDVVFVLKEQAEQERFLKEAGIAVITSEHRSVQGILNSISEISAHCNVVEEGAALRNRLEQRVDAVRKKVADAPRIRTMIAIGGDSEEGLLKNVFISGSDGYYNDILRFAGGENVTHGTTVSFPGISAEGVFALNPDVIIQIMAPPEPIAIDSHKILGAWQSLPMLKAVKSKRVYVVSDDFASIPGPRFVDLLERFAKLLHPERFLEGDKL